MASLFGNETVYFLDRDHLVSWELSENNIYAIKNWKKWETYWKSFLFAACVDLTFFINWFSYYPNLFLLTYLAICQLFSAASV